MSNSPKESILLVEDETNVGSTLQRTVTRSP